jgi:hypothetical protein
MIVGYYLTTQVARIQKSLQPPDLLMNKFFGCAGKSCKNHPKTTGVTQIIKKQKKDNRKKFVGKDIKKVCKKFAVRVGKSILPRFMVYTESN